MLDDRKDVTIQQILKILESPLGLAKILVCLSFTPNSEGLLTVREKLDSIKRMAAGLASAEEKEDYGIAKYATYLFAFQQFFHSSYRARQGNVLEAAVRRILLDSGSTAYAKRSHSDILEGHLRVATRSGHDVDVLASNKEDQYLIVQIRSRDDTGGTTAKGSLTELLRDILREGIRVAFPLLYVIYVWEPLERNQKQSLISKTLGQLQGLVDTHDFRSKLDQGVPVAVDEDLNLQLAYGSEEFSDILVAFTKNPELRDNVRHVLELTRRWDDLWLSYAIASLELENLVINGMSNFQVLDDKLRSTGITITDGDLIDYAETSKKYAYEIITTWTEDTLPVSSPADQLNYIRDLVLMKMIMLRIRDECKDVCRKAKLADISWEQRELRWYNPH